MLFAKSFRPQARVHVLMKSKLTQKKIATCSEIAISGLIIEYLKLKFITFSHVVKAFSAILF
jgi:hypothetical protein